eukprot:gene5657-6241_t
MHSHRSRSNSVGFSNSAATVVPAYSSDEGNSTSEGGNDEIQIHFSFISHQVDRIVDEEHIFDILSSKVNGIYRVEVKSRNVDYDSIKQFGYGFAFNDSWESAKAMINLMKCSTINSITFDCNISKRTAKLISMRSSQPPKRDNIARNEESATVSQRMPISLPLPRPLVTASQTEQPVNENRFPLPYHSMRAQSVGQIRQIYLPTMPGGRYPRPVAVQQDNFHYPLDGSAVTVVPPNPSSSSSYPPYPPPPSAYTTPTPPFSHPSAF